MQVRVFITKEGEKLYAQIKGQGRTVIYPESETKFFCKDVDAELTFVFDDKKDVKSLELFQNGHKQPAGKISDKVETKAEAKVDPEIYKGFVGDYGISSGIILTVTTEANSIALLQDSLCMADVCKS